MVDAGDEAVGDRRGGAEHDDEHDRRLGQLEQQDGEREPGDRRHRLQPGDQRADRGAQRSCDGATSAADRRRRSRGRARKPIERPAQRDPQRRRRRPVGDQLAERAGTPSPAPASTYSGFHPTRRRPATRARPIAIAASFGHVADQSAPASRLGAGGVGRARGRRPRQLVGRQVDRRGSSFRASGRRRRHGGAPPRAGGR